MTNLHVVPVGLSIVNELGRRQFDVLRVQPPQEMARSPKVRRMAEAADRRADGGDPGPSVEVDSLRAEGLQPADNLLLLASDTDDGEAAAKLVSVLLGRTTFTLCHSAQDWRIGDGPQTTIIRCQDLDPSDACTFRQGVASLIAALCLIPDRVSADSTEDVVIHLGGGFKATLPFLLPIVEIIANRCEPRVRASVLWERSNRPIDVPLRSVNFDDLREEISLARAQNLPAGRALFGNGFLHDGYGQLTVLGRALKTGLHL